MTNETNAALSALKENHDFERGYFCAVSALLRMEGAATTAVRDLFRCGEDWSKADLEDIEIFLEHGLLDRREI